MTYQQAESQNQRNTQIKKLLQAIANYRPTEQQQQGMKKAKRQMLKNIQKKFNNSSTNAVYKFPLRQKNLQNYQDVDFQEFKQNCQIENLYEQNFALNKIISTQLVLNIRRPLGQKSHIQNRYSQQENRTQILCIKDKNKQATNLNITQPISININKQKYPVNKRQITVKNSTASHSHKKSNSKVRQLKSHTFYQESTQNNVNQNSQNNGTQIRQKLKVKKNNENSSASSQLKTQNNVNCSLKNNLNLTIQIQNIRLKDNSFSKHDKKKINNYLTDATQIYSTAKKQKSNFQKVNDRFIITKNNQKQSLSKQAILQENQKLQEQSLYFSSKCNERIDENPDLQCPKQLFNVSYLKQKLRQTSKQFKTDQVKRHKRNVTEGDMDLKIKIFSNHKHKENTQSKSFKRKQITLKLFDDFNKSKQLTSQKQTMNKSGHLNLQFNCLMNRTLSNLSQSSAKKGIKILSKSKKQQKSVQKINYKVNFQTSQIQKNEKSHARNISFQKSQFNKNGEKDQIKNYTVHLKTEYSEQKKYHNLKDKNYRGQKQNNMTQNHRNSKINSIMQGLKQGYKNKNKPKISQSKVGIKTTIRS